MKRTSYSTGLLAESLCRLALRLKFYRILAKRYKTPFGEIDIVAQRGDTIAAIEVKARANRDEALESIQPKQRQRIERAALDFIARNPHFNGHNLRFDIMLVAPRALPVHIPDAWRPNI